MVISDDKLLTIKNRFGIVGNSPLLNRAIEVAVKVAPTDISVLLYGESGVGKEAFSKIIHQLSRRKHENFIAVNCGALPDSTINSELFGHEKGAFTGAVDSRKGYFETAGGGTIFLDEIGELSPDTQARLLRVLESGEFMRMGSTKTLKTDVRIIAATNKDLLEEANNGKFREDLYYRLSTLVIDIPPLRDRQDDIPLLFAKFVNDFGDKYNVPPLELTEEAERLLKSNEWPGNIRQLRNIVEQMSLLQTDRLVARDDIVTYLPKTPSRSLMPLNDARRSGGYESADSVNEREILYKFLIDMRQDLAEMKRLFYEFLSQSTGGYSPPANLKGLLGDGSPAYSEPPRSGAAGNTAEPPQVIRHDDDDEAEEAHHEEVREENEILSLEQLEKEMIRKALMKHNNKRKPASKELGISERTLYRKIKEFDLDNPELMKQ